MDLDKAVKTLLIKEPFYGLFLLGLNRYFDPSVETACVRRKGINTELCINPDYWDKMDNEEQLSLLKHELGHVLFKHFLMGKDFPNHTLFNIAADCEVNSYIPVMQKLPHSYAGAFKLENQLGTKEYYQRLQSLSNQPSPGEGEESHKDWKDFEEASDAEKEMIGKQIDYQAKQVAEHVQKIAGTIPGELSSYIDSLFVQKPAVFNWKSYFRRFLGTILDDRIRKSRKKESFRFPDSSGIKHKRKCNILLAIDTSGSVSDRDLCDFFSEINHVYKAGAVVTIMEFDHAIQRIYEYNGKWDGTCNGRGGTSFDEPWDYYIEHRKDFNTFVMFTDGYASTTRLRPVANTMWVITSDGDTHNNYPGKTIFIPKDN